MPVCTSLQDRYVAQMKNDVNMNIWNFHRNFFPRCPNIYFSLQFLLVASVNLPRIVDKGSSRFNLDAMRKVLDRYERLVREKNAANSLSRLIFFASQDETILVISYIFCCPLSVGKPKLIQLAIKRTQADAIWKPGRNHVNFRADCTAPKCSDFERTLSDKAHTAAALGSGFRECTYPPRDDRAKVVRAKKGRYDAIGDNTKIEKKRRGRGERERKAERV